MRSSLSLGEEARGADAVKRDTPVMVVIGNPPYSGISQNNGEWITKLVGDYKFEPGGKQKLQADVYILSYSIFTSYQWKSITLKIGDQAWGADCAGFSYEGKDQIATKAATFTVDAPPIIPPPSVTVAFLISGYCLRIARTWSAISKTLRSREVILPRLMWKEMTCVPLFCMLAKALSESACPKV